MELCVNGRKVEYTGANTLLAVLADQGADPGRVAVMVNDSIIKRGNVSSCMIKEGDRIEIMIFAGGG